MENLIYQNQHYSIWESKNENLYELAKFIVCENYKHHTGIFSESEVRNEIELVYQEELAYSDDSIIFLVRNNHDKIIGSIRVFKWNRKQMLPIQKIFNINPLVQIHSEQKYNYWHIGRFAIDSYNGISTLSLFKQLMVYAIRPIIKTEYSYMIAETDSKLLKVMNALGIKTVQLGGSVKYLASETIPVCSSREGLESFYNKYKNFCLAS